jgi:Ca2+-binding EF-hand superfamily protein
LFPVYCRLYDCFCKKERQKNVWRYRGPFWEEKRGYDSRRDKQEEILEEMFLGLDGDQDGLVDIDELRDVMAYVMEGETRTPEDLMADSDANGDGYIDLDEFVDMNFDSLY